MKQIEFASIPGFKPRLFCQPMLINTKLDNSSGRRWHRPGENFPSVGMAFGAGKQAFLWTMAPPVGAYIEVVLRPPAAERAKGPATVSQSFSFRPDQRQPTSASKQGRQSGM